MRYDEKDGNDTRSRELPAATRVSDRGKEVATSDSHVVFDFTGLHRPDVADLALILTARLRTPTDESVWVRAIHPSTTRVLRALGLDHLFRSYPDIEVSH